MSPLLLHEIPFLLPFSLLSKCIGLSRLCCFPYYTAPSRRISSKVAVEETFFIGTFGSPLHSTRFLVRKQGKELFSWNPS